MENYKVSTKVFPGVPKAHGAESLKRIFKESLEALKLQKVDILYLHAPDYTTPFEETIKAVDELYREGRFERVCLLTILIADDVNLISNLLTTRWHPLHSSSVCPTMPHGRSPSFTSFASRMDTSSPRSIKEWYVQIEPYQDCPAVAS